MAAANIERGEISVTLDGEERVLSPSWQAIVQVEQELGAGIVLIFQRVVITKDFRFGDALAVVSAGLESKADRDGIAKAILKTGYLTLIGPVSAWLYNAVSGGRKADDGDSDEGEAMAAGKMAGTPSAGS